MDLDQLSREEVLKLELATGVPVVFKLNGSLSHAVFSLCPDKSVSVEQAKAAQSRRPSLLRDSISLGRSSISLVSSYQFHDAFADLTAG